MALISTPRTWIAGEVVSAAQLNGEVRDPLTALQTPWDSYTPVWSAPTNPALGSGTLIGSYLQVGKTVHFRILLTMGASTTYGAGTWRLTLPVTPNADGARINFLADLLDVSAGSSWIGRGIYAGGFLVLTCLPATAGNADRGVAAAVPFAWGPGDALEVNGTYEAA